MKNDIERKKLEDLENYFKKAESYKVNKEWPIYQALETLYNSVKELDEKTKKFMSKF